MKPFSLLAAITLSWTGDAEAVVSITTIQNGDLVDLESVTIDRGVATFVYQAAELTGVDVSAFVAGSVSNLLVPEGGAAPAPGNRATLLEDLAINTGVINPARDGAALTVSFLNPVVNSDGADVLFFEIGNGEAGDPFSALGSLGTMGYTATDYTQVTAANVLDFAGFSNSPGAATLAELESFAYTGTFDPAANFEAFVVEIDLSDLGVAPGATVTELSFNSDTGGSAFVDPVLIVGLPAVPEPGAIAFLLVAFTCFLAARRNRT